MARGWDPLASPSLLERLKMKVQFIDKTFYTSTQETIDQANEIIHEYLGQGFSLTLRQLYYQMVARGLLPNKQKEYKRLGSIIGDARLAGLIDWRAIEDRTRELKENSHWSSPAAIVKSAVSSYAIDKWQDQPHRVEVWIEKDALTGVIGPTCRRLDVPYFSCRGYTSLSEMYRAGQRLDRRIQWHDQETIILHLGDHDPSGLDMTRDIEERLSMFLQRPVEVRRIALNMDQVEQYSPPPNPTKLSDSRAPEYVAEHGRESWELDALRPEVLTSLITDHVAEIRDEELWTNAVQDEAEQKEMLRQAAESLELD